MRIFCGLIRYVCETFQNRVLRFYVNKQRNFLFTVFYQFSGKLGPTAVATNQDDYLFVARYEYQDLSTEGEIAIINPKGQYIRSLVLPGYSEINGLQFSRQFK